MFLVKHIFIKIGQVLHTDTELLKSVLGISTDAQKVNFLTHSDKKCHYC